MKVLSLLALFFLLLFSGFSRSEQSANPSILPDEIAEIRKQIEGLQERVERLEKRLDRMSRPRMVPLVCIGITKELP
ncbi:MAG: hypothetical protein L0338_26770 [Acidobacteria bacterium]|nr:hypothetical protein [Acidobacteriota bacterium]